MSCLCPCAGIRAGGPTPCHACRPVLGQQRLSALAPAPGGAPGRFPEGFSSWSGQSVGARRGDYDDARAQ